MMHPSGRTGRGEVFGDICLAMAVPPVSQLECDIAGHVMVITRYREGDDALHLHNDDDPCHWHSKRIRGSAIRLSIHQHPGLDLRCEMGDGLLDGGMGCRT
jgi:hypothetical protein